MVHNANGLKSIRQIVAEVGAETVENMPDVTQKKSCKKVLTSSTGERTLPPVPRKLTVEQIVKAMRRRQGDMRDVEFARFLGISKSYLCDIYKGRKTPGEKVLSRLGFVKREAVTYEVA